MKHIHVKLFPRYIASPLYMGYRITHVMDDESSKILSQCLPHPNISADYFKENLLKLYAFSDFHLSGDPPTKPMDIFGENWKITVKNSLCMERNHYRRRHGHHGGRYFLGHSSGRCSFRPENAFRTPRPENHRPWQSRLLVEHRIKMKRMTDNAFEFIFNSALSVENIALAGTRGWIPETSKK